MKIAILPTIFLFFFQQATAQFQLAPVAGMNMSNIRYSNKATTEVTYYNVHGPVAGLNAQYGLTDRFNAQIEGAFSQKGYESSQAHEPGRTTVKINYLDFLALGEFSISKIINLNIGGNLGTKIGQKFNGHDGSTFEIHNGLDIGLVAGLKFYIGKFFVRTLYQHGINPIDSVILTDVNGQHTGEAHMYNRTFQVALGYYLF